MIERHLKTLKEKMGGHDPLTMAKRYRYSTYNPKGELYLTLVVEYTNGCVLMHRYKFNCNMFVGERIDHTIESNPTKESVRYELRKDTYKGGTGLRKYIDV